MRYHPASKIRASIRPLREPLQSRRGSLLIVVLVTIIMLSLAAYTFTALMQTEEEAARLMSRRVQSKYLVDSGVDFTRLFLSYDKDTIRERVASGTTVI